MSKRSQSIVIFLGILSCFLFLKAYETNAQTGVGQAFYVRGIGGMGSYHINVVALEDGTKVELYSIEKGNLVKTETLAKYAVFDYNSNKEESYKIIANKPVVAMFWGGLDTTSHYAQWYTLGYATFFPSTTGKFVGKEFVFMMGPGFLTAFAYEDTEVTLYNEDGSVLTSTAVTAGSWIALGQSRWSGQSDYGYESTGLVCSYQAPPHGDGKPHVYRVTSTGDIALAQWGTNGLFTAVPCDTGSFVGRHFLTAVISTYSFIDYDDDYFDATGIVRLLEFYSQAAFRVLAYEQALVKVIDVDTATVVYEKNLSPGEVWEVGNITQFDPTWMPEHWKWNPPTGAKGTLEDVSRPPMNARYLRFESTGDISVFAGHRDPGVSGTVKATVMGDDVTFLAGDKLRFEVNDAAVIFAPVDVKLSVNGEAKSLSKDGFLVLKGGNYYITSDHPIIVQLQQLGGPGGYDNYGTALVTTIEATATPPSLGPPMTLYGGVAAGIIVAVVVVFFLMRRRKAKT